MANVGLAPFTNGRARAIRARSTGVYPYLLRRLATERPNHVWCADVTYIPMRWGLPLSGGDHGPGDPRGAGLGVSNAMDAGFRVTALEETPARFGRPEIFNTDQGSQLISFAFISRLHDAEIRISMDGRGGGWTICSSSASDDR